LLSSVVYIFVIVVWKEMDGYPGAGFGIGEGMMVILHLEAAGGSYGLELMVFQVGLRAAGCGKRVEELVLGVIHLIGAEDGAKAAFVKGAVVGYQRQAFNKGLNLRPHIGEHWGIVGVSTT